MSKKINYLIFFSITVLASTAAVFGQSNRAYVAESGSDANQCTVGLLGGGNGISTARLSRTTINYNSLSGVSIGTNATVYSFQNNAIAGNFPDVNGNLTYSALK
ncbi:MAG: hypothetical protein WA584_04465 [Pyrinomonadaceae bacterium]